MENDHDEFITLPYTHRSVLIRYRYYVPIFVSYFLLGAASGSQLHVLVLCAPTVKEFWLLKLNMTVSHDEKVKSHTGIK